MTEFSEAGPGELADIRQFLAAAFGTDLDAPFLEPKLMEWKVGEPRPDWPSGRGFLLRKDGRIVAYACVVPMTWRTPAGPVRGVLPIDWAADAAVPGAGAVLHRNLGRLAPVVLQIGGTERARKVAPLLGLRPANPLVSYIRVLRPWRQHRVRPDHDWKSLPRLARNIWWGAAPLPKPPAGWQARPVRRFDDSMLPATAPELFAALAACERSATLLNYMLACPAAAMSGFQVLAGGEARGWFLLSRVVAQARIADLFVASRDPDDWRAAYALAASAAARDPQACELVAAGSTGLTQTAILSNGFRPRHSDPVWLGDPEKRLAGAGPLHLSMLESDAAYLYNPGRPFLA